MPEAIGPHLLGRKPSPPDARDYKLSNYLGEKASASDPLDDLLDILQHSRFGARVVKNWAVEVTARIHALENKINPTPTPDPTPTPTPDPTPTPTPSEDIVWTDDDDVLDQGNTGHCVGFGWAQWGNTLPVDDNFTNADGDAVYYECKVIDGEPRAEDGSDVRSGAKAMKNRTRLSAYAFAASITEVVTWVSTKGPVVFGTEWTNQMFTPDENGFVDPNDGDVQGGHCYVCVGYLPAEKALLFQNSWGTSWGLNGRFKMTVANAAKLLKGLNTRDGAGEACAAVELAA